MKVWRIADANDPTRGFYRLLNVRYGNLGFFMYNSFNKKSVHPAPSDKTVEPELHNFWREHQSRAASLYFGFHRKRLMVDWVSSADKTAVSRLCEDEEQRFFVYEYEGSNVKQFNKQCMFDLHKSTEIKKYHISNIFS